MVTFPDWFKGGGEDAENLVIDFLNPMVGQLEPAPKIYTWLPDLKKTPPPVIGLYRVKGFADPSKGTDYPIIHTLTIARKRSESVAIDEFLRQMLFTARNGAPVLKRDGTSGQIISCAPADGPEMLPGVDWDERMILSIYQLETKYVSNSLSDYEGIVRDLHDR